MWIPYTDSVVVVKCNQTKRTTAPATGSVWEKVHDNDSRLESMRALLTTSTSKTDGDIADLTAMQLRDELIALNPLDVVRNPKPPGSLLLTRHQQVAVHEVSMLRALAPAWSRYFHLYKWSRPCLKDTLPGPGRVTR